MRSGVWTVLAVLAAVGGFAAGYGISTYTGVEPGYFEAVETGGYGAPAAAPAVEGLSQEELRYYQELVGEE